MINTIKLSFQISMTYSVNGFIYWCKRIPFIKHLIPDDLYQKTDLKDAVRTLIGLLKVLWSFFAKMLYAFIFFVWLLPKKVGTPSIVLLNCFFFLSLLGSVLNSEMVSPTKEKYHVVILMKMNAKRYALAHYVQFLVKTFFPFLCAFFVISFFIPVSPIYALWLSVWVIGIKLLMDAFFLFIYEKKGIILKNKLWFVFLVFAFCLAGAYGIPYLFLEFSLPIWFFITLFVGTIILDYFSVRYLIKTNCYGKLYKRTVTMSAIVFDTDELSVATKQKQVNQFSKEISSKTTKKKGYDYFNSIFFERHKKILLNSALKFALVYLVIVGAIALFTIFDADIAKNVNQSFQKILPYFLFVMYFTNRGTIITQAMFFNCDHSMLSYQFYREPKVILNLFWARLKMLMKINAIPALVLALGIPLLLFLSGGVSPLYYGLTFLTIFMMSVFFSVHYMVLYYLLQPYDVAMKEKSTTYNILVSFTYLVCYFGLQIEVPTILFSTIVLIFSILYLLIALYLVYKKAPRTFRIHA